MHFHLLSYAPADGGKPNIISELFRAACTELGVEFTDHYLENLDYLNVPKLGAGDLLYRAAIRNNSLLAERLMITPECTTFRHDWTSAFKARACSFFLHRKLGLPVIPSVPHFPNTEEDLARVVQELGEFPMVVKVRGGSHGVGIIRVDSLPSLRSLLDYLRSIDAKILIRKYVEHAYYARLVVVGDRVVAGHCTFPREGEFRTNAGESEGLRRDAWVANPEVDVIAVQAVQSLGLETGGVDVLFDGEGKPWIAEVNFPNDFSTTQEISGVNIARCMVEHLVKKAEKANA